MGYRVAVVGATGNVGREMLNILEEVNFPVETIHAIASRKSIGVEVSFGDKIIRCEDIEQFDFSRVDIVLMSVSGAFSKEWSPKIGAAGPIVIDNSSAFRMDPAVPLVVPEINAAAIETHSGIIANPNCAAIIALMAMWPIHRRNRVRRATLATYQAASGAGAAAMAELREATRAFLDDHPFEPKVLPHPYAFNLFSHNTKIDPATGYNDEETKVINESRKILSDPEIGIGVTCIRVPVLRAHAIALTIECERPITPNEARALLSDAPGVRLVDDPERNYFPMPSDASGADDVLVGRIRRDLSDPSGHSLALFAAGDQLLKGAALNAVQIAERLLPQTSA